MSTVPRTNLRPSRIEIDLDAVRHNVAHLGVVSGAEVCAVIKADGYGHGAVAVGQAAMQAGAAWLAVAMVEEGVVLREAGLDAPILILAEPPVGAIRTLVAYGLTPVAYRAPFLAALDAIGRSQGRPVPVHLKADTGMARVGAPPPEWARLLADAGSAKGLQVDGVLTHLARADEPTDPTTDRQLDAFDRFLTAVEQAGLAPRWIHAANTAGTLLFPRATYDLVRTGIGIYGLSPAPDVDAATHGLRPALRLVTEVTYAKRVPAGTPVSYGHRWRTPEDGWLATVPVGYGDGVPRALTNRAEALVGGRRRPFAGTVCMDQLVLWCGDDEPRVGDEVVLIGRQGAQEIRTEDWARYADTITYEIVTQLTARLPRHYPHH